MKELLDNLRKALLETAGRAATALGNMPPADQMAGMQEVVAANSTLTWIKNDLENVLGRMAVATIDDEIKKLSDGAVAAALADGSLVKKVDADAAVIAAEGRVRQEEADKVAAEKTRLGVIAARRTEITTAHGEAAAAALSEEVLGAESFDGVATEVGRRVTELTAIGVTAAAKRETFVELLGEAPFSAEGNAAFDKTVGRIKEISGGSKGSIAATVQPAVRPGSGQPTLPAGAAPANTPASPDAKPAGCDAAF